MESVCSFSYSQWVNYLNIYRCATGIIYYLSNIVAIQYIRFNRSKRLYSSYYRRIHSEYNRDWKQGHY